MQSFSDQIIIRNYFNDLDKVYKIYFPILFAKRQKK